jgi:hypothetical protein
VPLNSTPDLGQPPWGSATHYPTSENYDCRLEEIDQRQKGTRKVVATAVHFAAGTPIERRSGKERLRRRKAEALGGESESRATDECLEASSVPAVAEWAGG